MARLVYTAIASLDGYVEDENGKFDWSRPDDEVHAFVNELERKVGTHLYGRRLYEVMAYWETARPTDRVEAEYADIWQAADKIVFSRTLETTSTERTRIERDFDPEAVRELKAGAERDLTVGGAELAAQAIAAGLVDELQLLVSPVLVGGGKRALPTSVRMRLELLETRRFANGVAYARYATAA